MAYVLGQQGSGWTPAFEEGSYSGGAVYYGAGYVAGFSGTLNFASVTVGGFVTASEVQVCLYTAANALVATCAAINISGGAGTYTGAYSSGSVVSGQTYYPVISVQSGYCNFTYNTGSSNFAANQNTAVNFPFGSPPGTLPAPDESVGHEYLVWIDATQAGGASVAWFV
jgi:hypothetical protein